MSHPKNSLAVTKVQAGHARLGPWRVPLWLDRPPKRTGDAIECVRRNTVHLHLDNCAQCGAVLGCGSPGDPPCPPPRGTPHRELPASPPARRSPLPWGSVTQGPAGDPGADRELAAGRERTKVQAAKGTKK